MTPPYPSDAVVRIIARWNLSTRGVRGLLALIEEHWEFADVGYFKLTGKKVLRLELHTGGWSDNERLIMALQKNWLFWGLYWEKSVRGGHYWFVIKDYVKEGNAHDFAL